MERPTRGGEVVRILQMLGITPMPWQQQVFDTAFELLPSGLPAFRDIGILTPRQSGKSTTLLAVELHRALMWGGRQRISYSAQTGQDGRSKLLDDQVPMLMASPLKAAVRRVYRAVGAEGVIFKTGSRIDVMASGEASGHGKVVDLGIVDEAFSDVDERREQAVKPAMMTKPDAQLWVASTAGTEGSVYLRRKVDAGRAAVADGLDRGVAYFEWSAEDGADIYDPQTWRSCMPALGITVTEDVVRQDLSSMPEGEGRRAYGNQWTVAEERVIPASTWNAVCSADVKPEGGLVFGIDAAADRCMASIVAVDGDRRAELVEHREGVGWLVDRVAELTASWGGQVAADEAGPVAPVLPELEAKGVRVERYAARRLAAACARLYDAVADRQVRIRQHPDLDLAAAAARKRVAGDVWFWARRDARADLSPLVALTVAYDLAADVGRAGEPWVVVER